LISIGLEAGERSTRRKLENAPFFWTSPRGEKTVSNLFRELDFSHGGFADAR